MKEDVNLKKIFIWLKSQSEKPLFFAKCLALILIIVILIINLI